jgi:hypothetical protein
MARECGRGGEGYAESEVAASFVQAKVEELIRENFHEKRLPKPSAPEAAKQET